MSRSRATWSSLGVPSSFPSIDSSRSPREPRWLHESRDAVWGADGGSRRNLQGELVVAHHEPRAHRSFQVVLNGNALCGAAEGWFSQVEATSDILRRGRRRILLAACSSAAAWAASSTMRRRMPAALAAACSAGA